MDAFFVTCRLTLLLRWIAPVENSPAGTTTRPPPARVHASTLRRNPSEQSNLPSRCAPEFAGTSSPMGHPTLPEIERRTRERVARATATPRRRHRLINSL